MISEPTCSAVRSSAWLGAVQITTPRRSHEKLGLVGVGGVLKHKPKALDLFCCAGGSGMGLHAAGYDVTGVDVRPQPRYPFRFIQGDALAQDFSGYDLVWASPPCQAHTAMKTMHNAKEHPNLIPATRAKLEAWGGLWIMENVVGAPLVNPVTLCGTMFGLGCEDAELRRHRLFECSVAVLAPECRHGQRAATMGVYGGHLRNRQRARTIGIYGEGVRDSVRKMDKGVADFNVVQGREAMGIHWMTLAELCQAIPPAYSEFLATHAKRILLGGGGAEQVGDEQRGTKKGKAPNVGDEPQSRAEKTP